MKIRFTYVPNVLTVVRLCIPYMVYLLLTWETRRTQAFTVFLLIWLTDALDGFLARKLDQMTPFGRLFDPLADKLFQASTAVTMSVIGQISWWVPTSILIREVLMILGSSYLLKRKDKVVKANWYGKVSTFLFVAAFAMLFFLPEEPVWLRHVIFIFPVAMSWYAFARYLKQNREIRDFAEEKLFVRQNPDEN